MYLNQQVHLMHMIFPSKQRLFVDKLHEDATNWPNINGSSVLGGIEQQLGRPVPSRHDILCHEVVLGASPRQPKVAYLEVTVGIEQQIARLQISMYDTSRMYVFQASQKLIQEVLQMQPLSRVLAWWDEPKIKSFRDEAKIVTTWQCSSDNPWFDRIIWWRSVSMSSVAM